MKQGAACPLIKRALTLLTTVKTQQTTVDLSMRRRTVIPQVQVDILKTMSSDNQLMTISRTLLLKKSKKKGCVVVSAATKRTSVVALVPIPSHLVKKAIAVKKEELTIPLLKSLAPSMLLVFHVV
jgi:hypothetical protein